MLLYDVFFFSSHKTNLFWMMQRHNDIYRAALDSSLHRKTDVCHQLLQSSGFSDTLSVSAVHQLGYKLVICCSSLRA